MTTENKDFNTRKNFMVSSVTITKPETSWPDQLRPYVA